MKSPSMASQVFSLFFFIFFLFWISVNGRLLQKNYTDESGIKVRAVSLATNNDYTGKTNYNDVLGLIALCNQYPLLLEDNEDPCLTPRWSWIDCNSDAKPRVTALNLNSKNLLGFLPDFSSMDALQTIDLSENSLTGPIPSFLGTFPDLQELNLAFNFFTGLVPDSIACNKNLKLSLTDNTGLYTSGSCSTSTNTPSTNTPSSTANRNTGSSDGNDSSSSSTGFQTTPATRRSRKKSKLPIILGSAIPASLVFWIAVGVFAVFRHKAKASAVVAEASKVQGPSNANGNIPTEEMPMNGLPNNMSP